ncbi:MAG: hypothetical protein CO062_01530, partial [Zetaproteobacteria bacterium CG_4_9_14_0_2_um_filter_59_191]
KEIVRLIDEKKAVFGSQIECKGTFFRKTFAGNQITLKSMLLKERVAITPYVIATVAISNFIPVNANADYNGVEFDINPGEYIAIGKTAYFSADKDFNISEPNISSIMTIKPSETGEYYTASFDNDIIEIMVPKADIELIEMFAASTETEAVIHGMIVLPVLAEAIGKLKKSDYDGNKWFKVLLEITEAKKIDISAPFVAAQQLLDKPISRGLNSCGQDD